MQLEVGSILEGKVTGITNFGAFVELAEGTTGMVHISEVAPTYVNQIRDHLTEGQTVKVKVLSVGDDGKISLSIKKAMDNAGDHSHSDRNTRGNSNGGSFRGNSRGSDRNSRGGGFRGGNGRSGGSYGRKPDRPRSAPVTSPGNFEWQSSKRNSDSGNFEDMMQHFKQTSDEKMSDLKRGTETTVRRPRKSSKPQ